MSQELQAACAVFAIVAYVLVAVRVAIEADRYLAKMTRPIPPWVYLAAVLAVAFWPLIIVVAGFKKTR